MSGLEHCDMHWGNVLVKATKKTEVVYTMAGEEVKVQTQGVKVAIIDFTLSRLHKCENIIDMLNFYDRIKDKPKYRVYSYLTV